MSKESRKESKFFNLSVDLGTLVWKSIVTVTVVLFCFVFEKNPTFIYKDLVFSTTKKIETVYTSLDYSF